MDQEVEIINSETRKEKIKNFFINNKKKLISIIVSFLLILLVISTTVLIRLGLVLLEAL